MAIDADLSAGMITEEEARKRRKELEGESNFYGAMDGASKFVRGDAMAGILITFINVIGGMIIGVAQEGITFEQAANSYTLLTVGDGIVSQIPPSSCRSQPACSSQRRASTALPTRRSAYSSSQIPRAWPWQPSRPASSVSCLECQ